MVVIESPNQEKLLWKHSTLNVPIGRLIVDYFTVGAPESNISDKLCSIIITSLTLTLTKITPTCQSFTTQLKCWNCVPCNGISAWKKNYLWEQTHCMRSNKNKQIKSKYVCLKLDIWSDRCLQNMFNVPTKISTLYTQLSMTEFPAHWDTHITKAMCGRIRQHWQESW